MRNIFVILITSLCFLSNEIVYGQSKELSHENRNSIKLNTTFYNFFDGGPFIQTNYTSEAHWLSNSYGAEYSRKVDSKNYWGVSLDYYVFQNWKPYNIMERGTYDYRYFIDSRGIYQRSIYAKNNFELFADASISLRIGHESVFGAYGMINDTVAEVFVLSKTLFDFGLSFGIKPQLYLGKHFHFFSSLDYTCYAYTFDSKDQNYSWDRGPTWNMIRLTFGIGINFGVLK
ncbi:MAG: hypothetical protein IPM77_15290 [Crocinitomicaceae bacterium]|nr:hypothetical protein [Crocinitomicaceae bacterium]